MANGQWINPDAIEETPIIEILETIESMHEDEADRAAQEGSK